MLFALLFSLKGYSQRVALGGDLLRWVTLSPNISADIVLSPKMSLDLQASFNPFNKFISPDISFKHITISPEVRYWLKRPFYSHYVGVNMLCSTYDLRFDDEYRNGVTMAIGVGYGYSIILSDRWNLVPSIGVGFGLVSNIAEPVTDSSTAKDTSMKLIPTRLGFTFTYIID